MRVLCNFTQCGPAFVRNGWRKVFQALGHQWRFWEPGKEPAFDVFNDYEPDVYLGTTYELDRATYKCLATRPEMDVALFASAWGPYLKDVDLHKYPLVVTTEEEKRLVERLKRETGHPEFVFIHAHGRWLEGTMSGWGEIGVPYHGILNAADTFTYFPGTSRPELACDAAMCGGWWPYKARNLEKFILPLCHPRSGLNVKLFGSSPWPAAQYLGPLSQDDERDLYDSATVCLNVSEPHSTDPGMGWDVIERPFKVLAAGGFCVSDHVEEARDLFTEDQLKTARTPDEYEALVRYYVAHPEKRAQVAEAGRREVLLNHTYFDRVAEIFGHLGMESERAQCLLVKADSLAGEMQ